MCSDHVGEGANALIEIPDIDHWVKLSGNPWDGSRHRASTARSRLCRFDVNKPDQGYPCNR